MAWDNLAEKTEVKEQEKPKTSILFKNLSEAKQDRGIKILSYGNFSTGKTHFALSSDKPVYIIDTENGASPLANKFPDAKVINICNTDFESVEEKDEVKNFENFQDTINYLMSIPDNEIGTIIIDSISDIWTWCQGYCKIKIFKLNIEDRLKQRFDWGIINNMFKKPIMKLINKNCNVIFTARESDIYDNASGPSGRVKADCQKRVPFYVDVVLRHELKFINKQFQFQVKIEKCRENGKIIGKTIVDLNLEKLKNLIKENE